MSDNFSFSPRKRLLSACSCGQDENDKARICGDVDYEAAAKVAGFITPVPGGVGPMTVSMLLSNTFEAAKRYTNKYESNEPWSITLLPLNVKDNVPEDIEIAKTHFPKDIARVAQEIRLLENEYECYGKKKAKVSLKVLERRAHQPNGNYVVVAGINPTPLGEGKSTTTVGLCQALCAHLKKNTIGCLRQPSQGPTFGIKGKLSSSAHLWSRSEPSGHFSDHSKAVLPAAATPR